MEKLVIWCRTLCTIAFKKQTCQLYMQICDILTNPSKIFYYMQSHKGKIQIHFFFFLGDKIDPYLIFLLGEPRLKVQLFLISSSSFVRGLNCMCEALHSTTQTSSFWLFHDSQPLTWIDEHTVFRGETSVSLAKQWSKWLTNLLFY